MDDYIGQLVVLRSRWNINSFRIGIVVGQEASPSDILHVMWTTEDGVKIKFHLQDAVIPVTDYTVDKIEERICDIK